MSLSYDIIKMNLVREGYLPNHPYHMVSDAEMCDAFMGEGGFFYDNYPCPHSSLQQAYDDLVAAIKYHISLLKESNEDSYDLPDWVQSYMLGVPLGENSDKLDLHDMLVSLNVDNIDDNFTVAAAKACYAISKQWVKKLPTDKFPNRPPTMFGEPHVLKHLRLQEVNAT